MIIEVYGKKDCKLCKSAEKKVEHFLEQWQLAQAVQLVFQDVTTEHGAAESDFFDVFEIPSVLLKRDQDSVLARWDGHAPHSEELQRRLCA